ncbi:hypothetical protein BDV3_002104 [Batrachochytrium dendrobatidis]
MQVRKASQPTRIASIFTLVKAGPEVQLDGDQRVKPKKSGLGHLLKSHLGGFPEATALLAFCFEFGLAELQVDHILAERLYIQAATSNSGFAQGRLEFLKTHGRPDIKINHVESAYWRAKCGQNNCLARAWLITAAESGLAAAQFCLALCYYNGISTQKDYALAFQWCKQAAQQGLPAAQNVLGNLYLEGSGCTLSTAIGLEWYTKAAAKREAAAIYNIGTLFERGMGIEQNYGRAYEWYMRAASYGSINAQNVLGIFLEQGIGVEANPHQAVQYYTRAALCGHPHAQYNLARCYHEGFGLQHNDYLALAWFEKAARQNHVLSILSTAISYEFGIGTKKCLETAEKLYGMAAKRGSKEAHTRLVPIVAKRLLNYASVLLPARPAGLNQNCVDANGTAYQNDCHRVDTKRLATATSFCAIPNELRRLILKQLDGADILSRTQMELIYQAAVEASQRHSAQTLGDTTCSQYYASKRDSSIPVIDLNVASSHASAAHFVVERLCSDAATAIDNCCSCLTSDCQKIKHVIQALESIETF